MARVKLYRIGLNKGQRQKDKGLNEDTEPANLSFILLPLSFVIYAPAGTAPVGGGAASFGFNLICNASPAAIIAITPPDRKAN